MVGRLVLFCFVGDVEKSRMQKLCVVGRWVTSCGGGGGVMNKLKVGVRVEVMAEKCEVCSG